MHLLVRRAVLTALAFASVAPISSAQQPPVRLLERAATTPAQSRGIAVATIQQAFVRADPRALAGDRIELTLFELQVVARRTSRSHPRTGSTVWHGALEAPHTGEITLAAVDGVIAGSMTLDGRSFEIGFAGNGLHEVRETNPAGFPDEDFPVESLDLLAASGTTATSEPMPTSQPAGQIDVMVVWTPAARMAAGGTAAAIQSVIDLAVANANAAYSQSQVPATLHLVYSGEVDFVETPDISTDLLRLRGTSDGYVDQVHSLRNQYGADAVTLLGSGYTSRGYCGVGYLMSTPSSSFAASAFNIVDRSCAAGNLTYAHEVGHNQGLHHDPPNASGTPTYPFAYGYQDPGGAFRTVMSYGSATRIQRLSNPNVFYSGKATGTSTQNNAEALRLNAAIVAGFRAPATQTCSFTVTPTALSFSETGGTGTVSVTTAAGCSWSAASAASWVTAGAGGSGSGSVVVTVAPNGGSARSTTITIAGATVTISEAGTASSCTYVVAPTGVSFGASGGSTSVGVTTQSGCSWTTSSGASWVSVSPGGSGSGTVTATSAANTGGYRNATVTIAEQPVTVAQAAPAPACSYEVSPVSATLPASGGSVTVQVTTGPECTWTARSNTGWMKVTGGGTGSGTATLQVNATSGGSRTATATVAGQTVTVTMTAAPKSK